MFFWLNLYTLIIYDRYWAEKRWLKCASFSFEFQTGCTGVKIKNKLFWRHAQKEQKNFSHQFFTLKELFCETSSNAENDENNENNEVIELNDTGADKRMHF